MRERAEGKLDGKFVDRNLCFVCPIYSTAARRWPFMQIEDSLAFRSPGFDSPAAVTWKKKKKVVVALECASPFLTAASQPAVCVCV